MLPRNEIWNCLINSKFKALYMCLCSEKADNIGRLYSIALSLGSASSVAAWAVWKEYPYVWAIIVGFAQLLHIIKPYIPFIGNDKEYLEMSFRFEELYIDYNKLWKSYEREEVNDKKAGDKLSELYKKEIEIEKSNKKTPCPNFKRLSKKARTQLDTFLKLHY